MGLILRAELTITRGLTRVAPGGAVRLHTAAVRRLANHLSQRGKFAAALAVVESAVAGRGRRDPGGRSSRALGELQRVLAQHRHTASGPDPALAAADEAVRLHQSEPATRTGRRLLARARTTRSHILWAVGQPEAALADAQLAAAELRQSARLTWSERHALVLALRSQARSLGALGRWEDAAGVSRTAIDQLGRLPWHLRVRLVQVRTSLRVDLAEGLLHTGQPEAARALTERAESWAAAMDNRVSAGFRDIHARQQLVLALAAAGTDDHQTAGVAARRAAELYRSLAARDWYRYAPSLAEALLCQSRMRTALDHADPVTPIREGVEITARLAADRQEQYAEPHVQAVGMLSDRLWAAGAHAESLAATRETLDLYQRLPAALRGEASETGAVRAGCALTWRLTALGDLEEAVRTGTATVERARRRAATGRHRDLLRLSLGSLSDALHQAGQSAAARECATELATIGRELAQADPARFGDLPAADQGWLDSLAPEPAD